MRISCIIFFLLSVFLLGCKKIWQPTAPELAGGYLCSGTLWTLHPDPDSNSHDIIDTTIAIHNDTFDITIVNNYTMGLNYPNVYSTVYTFNVQGNNYCRFTNKDWHYDDVLVFYKKNPIRIEINTNYSGRAPYASILSVSGKKIY